MYYNLPQVPSVQRRLNAGNTQEMLFEPVKDESPEHFSFFLKSGCITGGTVHTPWNPPSSLCHPLTFSTRLDSHSRPSVWSWNTAATPVSARLQSVHTPPRPPATASLLSVSMNWLCLHNLKNRIVQYVSLESGCLTLGMMFLRFVRGVAHIR